MSEEIKSTNSILNNDDKRWFIKWIIKLILIAVGIILFILLIFIGYYLYLNAICDKDTTGCALQVKNMADTLSKCSGWVMSILLIIRDFFRKKHED